ncbi:MAG: hypothetical protein JWO52_37 [Gammaproteobacteria bacterium]|jgi:hypothetical protein|nr:hypothetical protein [Gammaproteobacteria bacterium]
METSCALTRGVANSAPMAILMQHNTHSLGHLLRS